LNTFSYFDSGNKPLEAFELERYYHGFVLGLVVELAERYVIKSNWESGFGRYDVMMIPKDNDEKASLPKTSESRGAFEGKKVLIG
jgi:hypothetical protein